MQGNGKKEREWRGREERKGREKEEERREGRRLIGASFIYLSP